MENKVFETRALPSLVEQRNTLLEEMKKIIESAKEETRALKEDEIDRYDEIKKQISAIDSTLKAEEEQRSMLDNKKKESEKQEDIEVREFAAYIRGAVLEQRAATNFEKGSNGDIIPKTIASKIIEQVKELSPIYSMAEKYNVKGELVFPSYDETAQKIQCAYANEFTALTSTAGKFTSISLKGFLAGALTKISRSLINNTDFDLVSFVIRKMAQAVSEFLEKECLIGTADKMSGVFMETEKVTAASETAITTDELIDLQMSVPQVYQQNACWIMHKDTLKALRKLKDSDGKYLLNQDLTAMFGWVILGKPVYISENAPKMAAGNAAIAYGDMSGLYIKLVEGMEIQVLQEKFADEHAVGVVAWIEVDSKVVEKQKIAVLKMKAAG